MNQQLPHTDILLFGAGYTHLHVLRMWRAAPIRDARLTLVSDFPIAIHPRMLPSVLAGSYRAEAMQIDLVRLCAAVGARLVIGDPTEVDLGEKRLQFPDRPPLSFDVLSIETDPSAEGDRAELDSSVVLVRPMQTFVERFDARLRNLADARSSEPLRVGVVGGGLSGAELALCLPPHIGRMLPERAVEVSLIDSHAALAENAAKGVSRLVRRAFERRGTPILLNRRVVRVAGRVIEFDDGSSQSADVVVWAAELAAHPILASIPLPKDDRGRLLTHRTLQTLGDSSVFAVGKSGSIQSRWAPQSSSNDQGPILWGNLHRQVFGRPLIEYQPRRRSLTRMTTGDRRAIVSYQGVAFHGAWCWRIGDRIDRRLVEQFQDYSPKPSTAACDEDAIAACTASDPIGGMTTASLVGNVLRRLGINAPAGLSAGVARAENIAVVRPPAETGTASVNMLTLFADDPYLVGRVAALGAASDLFAIGARPWGAMAMASLTAGPARQQEQLLHELLAGGLRELQAMNATLIGANAVESTAAAIGFCMLGGRDAEPSVGRPLQEGDQLVLTRPLGSGILLSAWQRAECRAQWRQPLLNALLRGNQTAAEIATGFDVAAMTPVSNAGLAGALVKLIANSSYSVEAVLDHLPLLDGVEELLQRGWRGTLPAANRGIEESFEVSTFTRKQPAYGVLFDPQIAGGLLIAVRDQQVAPLLSRLADAGDGAARVIGQVKPIAANGRVLKVV